MTEHARICGEIFARPSSRDTGKIYDGYLSAMRGARYAQLMRDFDITTNARAAALLATWAHETGGFRILWESGNYSVEGILRNFGEGRHSAAITPAEARKLAHNPVALFERTYGLGNPHKARELGNTQPGDGWRFRGLGASQITGRADHERYARDVGCSLDALPEPINTLHAGLLEWRRKGCNARADAHDLRGVRRAINGGMNGWEDFSAKYALIDKALRNDNGGPLMLGSRGPEVQQLQSELKVRGFYESGTVDDNFGALTKRAVVAFQAAHGLEPHGTVDDATAAKLAEVPPEPTLPGRKAIDIVGIGDRFVRFCRYTWKRAAAALGLYEAGDQLGLEPANKVLDGYEKARDFSMRLQVQPRFVVYAAIAVVLVALWYFANAAEAEFRDKQKSGKA